MLLNYLFGPAGLQNYQEEDQNLKDVATQCASPKTLQSHKIAYGLKEKSLWFKRKETREIELGLQYFTLTPKFSVKPSKMPNGSPTI